MLMVDDARKGRFVPIGYCIYNINNANIFLKWCWWLEFTLNSLLNEMSRIYENTLQMHWPYLVTTCCNHGIEPLLTYCDGYISVHRVNCRTHGWHINVMYLHTSHMKISLVLVPN